MKTPVRARCRPAARSHGVRLLGKRALAVIFVAAIALPTCAFVPRAHAVQQDSSVDILLMPLENDVTGEERASSGDAAEDVGQQSDSSSSDGGEGATASPLPETGDAVGTLAIVAAALIVFAGATAVITRLSTGRPSRSGPRPRDRESAKQRRAHALEPWRSPRNARRTSASGVLRILLAVCVALGSATLTTKALADEQEADDATSQEESTERFEPTAPSDEAQAGASGQAESEPSPADGQSTGSSASQRAEPARTWTGSAFEVFGMLVIGSELRTETSVRSDYPQEIEENLAYRWTYQVGDEEIVFSTADTCVIPDEAFWCELRLYTIDTTGYIPYEHVFPLGKIGKEITGTVSIEGDLVVGATLSVDAELPEGAVPAVTWYMGYEPGEQLKELGTGPTYELTWSEKGRYITAVVKDQTGVYKGKVAGGAADTVLSIISAPSITSATLHSDGTATVDCAIASGSARVVRAASLQALDENNQWAELARKEPGSDGTVTFDVDLGSCLADGSTTVRAYSHGLEMKSGQSNRKILNAQISVSVPVSMTCTVLPGGSTTSPPHVVQNTGDLDVRIASIETTLDGAFQSGGLWTCSSESETLFEGPFGSARSPASDTVVSPGDSIALDWRARGLTFEDSPLGSEPARYGAITYTVTTAAAGV